MYLSSVEIPTEVYQKSFKINFPWTLTQEHEAVLFVGFFYPLRRARYWKDMFPKRGECLIH